MIETDLVGYIKGLAVVGERIYPHLKPQKTDLPVVVYHRISTARRLTHSGPVGKVKARFQIDIIAETFEETRRIGTVIRQALHGYRGYMGTTFIGLSALDNEIDLPDAETRLFRKVMDFLIWYEE